MGKVGFRFCTGFMFAKLGLSANSRNSADFMEGWMYGSGIKRAHLDMTSAPSGMLGVSVKVYALMASYQRFKLLGFYASSGRYLICFGYFALVLELKKSVNKK